MFSKNDLDFITYVFGQVLKYRDKVTSSFSLDGKSHGKIKIENKLKSY